MKIPTKRGYTIYELLVVLVIGVFIAAVLFPIYAKPRDAARRANCQSNLKQIGLAMIQYAQDYQEKFPPVALHDVASSAPPFARPYGWADAIQRYLGNTAILHCPSETSRTSVDGVKNGFTDYWMNANMSARQWKQMVSPAETFLCGEGNDGSDFTNARYQLGALPQRWIDIDDENSPAWRHVNTANYLYADGHVKAMPPKTAVSNSSFMVQRR